MFIKISLSKPQVKGNSPISWKEEFTNVLCYNVIDKECLILDVHDYIDELIEMVVSRLNDLFWYHDLSIKKSESIHELVNEKHIQSFCIVQNGEYVEPGELDPCCPNKLLFIKIDEKIRRDILKYFTSQGK